MERKLSHDSQFFHIGYSNEVYMTDADNIPTFYKVGKDNRRSCDIQIRGCIAKGLPVLGRFPSSGPNSAARNTSENTVASLQHQLIVLTATVQKLQDKCDKVLLKLAENREDSENRKYRIQELFRRCFGFAT